MENIFLGNLCSIVEAKAAAADDDGGGDGDDSDNVDDQFHACFPHHLLNNTFSFYLLW